MSRQLLARASALVAAATTALTAAALAACAPAAAANPDPPGCGAPPQPPGTSALRTMPSGGRDRTYQLHLPADYGNGARWPVVIAFHGRGSTGPATEAFSGLSRLPAILAYPNGVVGTGDGDQQAWQGAPYAAPGVDDVAFTNDLLDELERSLCVDATSVYATGKSNGAGFTSLLACRDADRFAAIAPVSGAYYPGTSAGCAPSRPVPVIAFHGTGDTTIPYAGDADRGLPAIGEWAASWADRDHCTAGPATSTAPPDITRSDRTACAGGSAVSLVSVTGGGHTWPGADAYSGGGRTTRTIEATDVLWDFVSRHHLGH